MRRKESHSPRQIPHSAVLMRNDGGSDRHSNSAWTDILPAETNALPSVMSYNLKETSSYLGSSLTPTPEEQKGLLSNFDVEDRDNGEPPRYEDEEYAEPRERALLERRRIVRIAGGFVALVLGALFFAPTSGSWCSGMGGARRPTDPSGLLSNGTHEFKRTVLIVSFDGLR